MSLKKLAVLALPLVIVSCGSDNGGGSSSNPTTTPGASISSQFIDAPVKGMNVEGSVTGKKMTADNGAFSCANGEELTFSLANVEIGKTNCNSWIHLFDLAPSSGITLNKAASLIQSLSTGSDVLDLSSFNAKPEAATLTALTTVDSSYVSLLNIPGLVHVDETEAMSRATSNLKDLSSDSIFSELASATTTPQEVFLKGASSNNQDDCFETVRVKLKVEEADMSGGKKAYQFKVTEYKAYDGETAPTECDEDENYDCSIDPFSKYITGRTIIGSKYDKMGFKYDQGDTIACYSVQKEEYYVSEDTVEGVCDSQDKAIKASKAQEFEFDFGMNFNIEITDTNIKIGYFEKNSNFSPVFSNENDPDNTTVYLQQTPDASCSYSGSIDI